MPLMRGQPINAALKHWCRRLGLAAGPVRQPLRELTASQAAALDADLDAAFAVAFGASPGPPGAKGAVKEFANGPDVACWHGAAVRDIVQARRLLRCEQPVSHNCEGNLWAFSDLVSTGVLSQRLAKSQEKTLHCGSTRSHHHRAHYRSHGPPLHGERNSRPRNLCVGTRLDRLSLAHRCRRSPPAHRRWQR